MRGGGRLQVLRESPENISFYYLEDFMLGMLYVAIVSLGGAAGGRAGCCSLGAARNHPCVTWCSTRATQAWIAFCYIQLFIYYIFPTKNTSSWGAMVRTLCRHRAATASEVVS